MASDQARDSRRRPESAATVPPSTTGRRRPPRAAGAPGDLTGLQRRVQQLGLLGAALGCALALLACLLAPPPVNLAGTGLVGTAWLMGYALLAAASLAGLRLAPNQTRPLLWLLVPGAGLMVALGAALCGPNGLAAGLPLLAWLLGLSAALGGLALSGLATGLTLVLLLAAASPLWPAALALAREPGPSSASGTAGLGNVVATAGLPLLSPASALLLASALIGACGLGWLVHTLLVRLRQAAAQADQQLTTLRAIATDAHWQTDASLRLTQLAWRDRQGLFVPMPDVVGRRPWDLPVMRMHPDTQDLMRADAEAREPLRHLPLAWRCPDGRLRHFLISGMPRFDAQGRFAGYWGVARDITAVRAARSAMRAGEQRFDALFRRVPTPLLLLRHGRILQANAAAATLLGYDGTRSMQGQDLLARHMDDEQRDLAMDRFDELDGNPGLELLPAMPRRLLRCDGQPVNTMATAWRADQASGPAVLALFMDQSGPQADLASQQRSNAVLSRVMALSQDSITLSDLVDGRCVMANDAFLRLSGHSRADLAATDPAPLATWPRPQDRQLLLREVQAHGVVREMPVDLLSAHGQRLVLMVSATQVQQDSATLLLTLARDVSLPHRLRLERDALLALSPVGILLVRRGRVVLANAAAERLLGWPTGGLVGQAEHLVWPTPATARDDGQDSGSAVGHIMDTLRADGSRLPLRTLSRAVDAQHPEDGRLWLIDRPRVTPALSRRADGQAHRTAAAPRPLAGARVLLVEDDPVNTLVVQALLEDWGVAVTSATDGPQALEALARAQVHETQGNTPFDVVLMDLELPGMNGFDTTAALRRRYAADTLPVLAFSAEAQAHVSAQAAALGMSGFVGKPADPQHLLATLRRLLGSRHLGRALAKL